MKVRILSAIAMTLLTIPFLLLGEIYFDIYIGILAILGLYELLKLKPINNMIKIIAYIFLLDFLFINETFNTYLIILLLLFLLIPIVFINDENKYNIDDAIYVIFSTLFIYIAFKSIMFVRNLDLNHILYLGIITILTDAFAYFTGSLYGKHKLCPKISPNKTIEGFIGGTVVGSLVGYSFYITFIGTSNLFLCLLGSIVLSLFGSLGDLLFSSIKRYFKIKDFSNLIPGHGGILDRLDSLIFATMVYVILFKIL